ncbi:MAG: hypothetical protein ACRC7V_08335 [Lachnospiraceae bacterium]
MKQKQKKNQIKNQNKNQIIKKDNILILFYSIILIIVTIGISFYNKMDTTDIYKITFTIVICYLAILFLWFQSKINGSLEYSNEFHQTRFSTVCFLFFIISLLQSYLPEVTWFIVAMMIITSLLSNTVIGIISGSFFLCITCLISGEFTLNLFFMHYIVSCICCLLFRKIDVNFKIKIPLLLSSMVMFLFQFFYIEIFDSLTLIYENILLTVVYVFINLFLIIIALKIFTKNEMFQIRDKYLEINDPEFPILTEMKKNNKDNYFLSIHTAYLSNKIAKKLHANDEIAKACAYYSRIELEKLQEIYQKYNFPDDLIDSIKECTEKKFSSKESIIAFVSYRIITRIERYMKQNGKEEIPYDDLIENEFAILIKNNLFFDSDLTLKEIEMMKEIFLEEKLYYDFLY